MHTQKSLYKRHAALADAILSSPQPWSTRRQGTALLWEYRLGFKRTKNTLLQFVNQLGPIQGSTNTLLSTFVATKFIGHPALPQLSGLVERLFMNVDKDNWPVVESATLTLLLLSLYQGNASGAHDSQPSIRAIPDRRDDCSQFVSILGNYQSADQQLLRKYLLSMSQHTSVLNSYVQDSILPSSEHTYQLNVDLTHFKIGARPITGNFDSHRPTAISILKNRGENLREAILNSIHNANGDTLLLGQITCFNDLLTFIKDLGAHEQLLAYNNLSTSLEARKKAKPWAQPNLYLMSWEALVDRYVDQYFGIDIVHEVANKLTDAVLFDLYLTGQSARTQNIAEEIQETSPASLMQLQELETMHSVIYGYRDHLKHCILHDKFPNSIEILDICVVRGSSIQSKKMLTSFYVLVAHGILRKLQQLIIAETYRMYAGGFNQESHSNPQVMELGIGRGIPIVRRCLFHGFENIELLSSKSTLDALFQRRWAFTESMQLIEELVRPIQRIWLPLSLRSYAGILTELFNLGSLLSMTRVHCPILLRTLFLYTSTVAGTMIHQRASPDIIQEKDSVDTLLFSSEYEFYKPKDTFTSRYVSGKPGLTYQIVQESAKSYIPRTVSFLEQEQIRRDVICQLQAQTEKFNKSVVSSTSSIVIMDSRPDAKQESLLPGTVASHKEILAVISDLKSHFMVEMGKLGMDIRDKEVVDGLNRQFKLLLTKHAPMYAELYAELESGEYIEDQDSNELVAGVPLRSSVTEDEKESSTSIELPESFTSRKTSKDLSAPFDRSLDTQALLDKEDLQARKKIEERIEKAKKRDEVRRVAIERDRTLPLRKRKFKTAKEVIENTEYDDIEIFFDWDEYLQSEFSTLVDSLRKYNNLANSDAQDTSLISSTYQYDDMKKGWCHFTTTEENISSLHTMDVNYRRIIAEYMRPIQLLHKLTNIIICNYLLYESNLSSCIDTIGDICFLLDSNLTNKLLSALFKHGSSTWVFDASFQEQRMLSVLSRYDLRGVAAIITFNGSLNSADVCAHNKSTARDKDDDIPQQGHEVIDYIVNMNKTLSQDLCTVLKSRLIGLYTSINLLCNPHSGSSLPIHSIISPKDITGVLAMYSSKCPRSISSKDNGVLNSLMIKEDDRRTYMSHGSWANFTMLLDFSASNALFHQLYYAPLEPLLIVIFKHILALSQSLYSLHSLWFLLIVSDKDRKRYSALERRTRKLLAVRHSACCFLQIFLRFLLGDVHSTLQNAKQCIFKALESGANVFQSVDQWHTLIAITLARLFLTDPHRTIFAAIKEAQRHVLRFCSEVRAYIDFSKVASGVVANYEEKLTEVFWRASNAGLDLQHAIDEIVACLTHYVEKLGVTRYEEILAQFSLLGK